MEYSIIKDGEVLQRMLCDEGFAQLAADSVGGTYTDDINAQVGCKLVDGEYIPPKGVKQPERKFSLNDLDKEEMDSFIDLLDTSNVITNTKAKKHKRSR